MIKTFKVMIQILTDGDNRFSFQLVNVTTKEIIVGANIWFDNISQVNQAIQTMKMSMEVELGVDNIQYNDDGTFTVTVNDEDESTAADISIKITLVKNPDVGFTLKLLNVDGLLMSEPMYFTTSEEAEEYVNGQDFKMYLDKVLADNGYRTVGDIKEVYRRRDDDNVDYFSLN